jgi:hypothetical protein
MRRRPRRGSGCCTGLRRGWGCAGHRGAARRPLLPADPPERRLAHVGRHARGPPGRRPAGVNALVARGRRGPGAGGPRGHTGRGQTDRFGTFRRRTGRDGGRSGAPTRRRDGGNRGVAGHSRGAPGRTRTCDIPLRRRLNAHAADPRERRSTGTLRPRCPISAATEIQGDQALFGWLRAPGAQRVAPVISASPSTTAEK